MFIAMTRGYIAVVGYDKSPELAEGVRRAGENFTAKWFKSGDSLLEASLLAGIDCILLDLRGDGSGGLALLSVLAEREDAPPVLAIVAHGAVPAGVEAMKRGARDFVVNPFKADTLGARLAALVRASGPAQGEGIDREAAAARVAALSGRQRQVLDGIMRGLQNKGIAYRLGLSIRTIEAYRAQLLERLGVHGTADIVRIALAAGIGGNTALP